MKPKLIKDLGMKIYSNRNRRYGLYQCLYCSNTFESLQSAVNSGDKKTCGCKTNDLKKHITHNLTNHKLYKVWSSIKQRCYNEKNPGYNNYGGRGISVCNEWVNDFKAFYNWSINNGYKEGLSIDRINNDGNYEPSNCRFVSYDIQNCNKRFYPSSSGFIGVAEIFNRFTAKVSINDKSFHIGTFKTALEAALARDLYIIDNNLKNKRNFNLRSNNV